MKLDINIRSTYDENTFTRTANKVFLWFCVLYVYCSLLSPCSTSVCVCVYYILYKYYDYDSTNEATLCHTDAETVKNLISLLLTVHLKHEEQLSGYLPSRRTTSGYLIWALWYDNDNYNYNNNYHYHNNYNVYVVRNFQNVRSKTAESSCDLRRPHRVAVVVLCGTLW